MEVKELGGYHVAMVTHRWSFDQRDFSKDDGV